MADFTDKTNNASLAYDSDYPYDSYIWYDGYFVTGYTDKLESAATVWTDKTSV